MYQWLGEKTFLLNLLYGICDLFYNQRALGINMHQTLIPLIMASNTFATFFPHWNQWGVLWMKLKVKGSKLGLQFLKIFCGVRLGSMAVSSGFFGGWYKPVLLHKLASNHKLPQNGVPERKKALAVGERHHSGKITGSLLVVLPTWSCCFCVVPWAGFCFAACS